MTERRWIRAGALTVVGVLLGAGTIIASTEINRLTSTDAFCTSCHSMATLAAEPKYQQSTHRANAAGMLASCADCHLPATNWFVEIYGHAVYGIKDTIAEYTGGFSNASAWDARRSELANRVRDDMRKNAGLTCRKCHEPAAIHPRSAAGRAAHASLQQSQMACIDCHSGLVHATPTARANAGQGL